MQPLAPHNEPEASRILLVANSTEGRSGAVDHQCAEEAIALLAGTEQTGSPSTGPLFRDKPKPGRN